MIDLHTMPTADDIGALQPSPGERLNLAPFAPVIRRINAANGWVPEWSLEQLPTRLALIHTEFRKAREALLDPESHAEEVENELADIIIRCLDTVELMAPGWLGGALAFLGSWNDRVHESANTDAQLEWLADIRDGVDEAMQSYCKITDDAEMITEVRGDLAWTAQRVTGLIGDRGVDPATVLIRVMHKTTSRGLWHGGRRV